jgi:glutamate formiminotransferase/formiminotetrahydrofolate cyclodeaminase
LSRIREELKAAIDADAESYNLVMKAYKAAKESDRKVNDSDAGISTALKQATSIPLGVAEKVVEVAEIAAKLRSITSPNMKSDLTTAIALAKAALEGALANVELNLDSLKNDSLKNDSPKDEAFVTETRKRAAALRG